MLAETNRTPFDLTEAEAELVAGYNVEYSSIIFAMFFLAEYSNMLLMSAILVSLFVDFDSLHRFCLKMIYFVFYFVLVRATFPRYKYNQLMDLGWKVFLPISLSFVIFLASMLFIFGGQTVQY
jgi:NADH:ubiquinone oxidoreductase subunit H